MSCRRSCKKKELTKANTEENVTWVPYPRPDTEGFGHGKFCYFISCSESKLPIRDFVYEEKLEPHYETRSYNEYACCNQIGIKSARKRGISYIIFYTKYQGKEAKYQDRYFITGLFPISDWRKVSNHIAYRSDNPIFLSIEDAEELELNDKTWRKWFEEALPRDRKDRLNLRWMAKFVRHGSLALQEILDHFERKKEHNRIEEYIKELSK